MSDYRPSPSYLVQQITIQRKNLLTVCKSTIKSLLDKASHEPIEGSAPEVLNFCAVLEHILSHRLKPVHRWYGSDESRWFWDYIKNTCTKVPHSCLSSIESMGKPKTARGKGRAWIRMALMEKRLSEYISAALEQPRVTRSFYMDGSIMLTEDIQAITGTILGLNVIDFSFDIRSDNLDFIILPVIDYASFMKYTQRDDNDPILSVTDEEGNVGDQQGDFWKQKYNQLFNQSKTISEQKGYLEELVRVREGQLEELHGQREKVINTLHHYENESRRERQQLENVIIELQAQIMELKDYNKVQGTKILILEKQHGFNHPSIAMSDLITPEEEPEILRRHELAGERLAHDSCELHVPPLSPYKGPTPHPDAKPVAAERSGVPVMYVAAKEDTQSMIVLAGSYSSDAGETTQAAGTSGQIYTQAGPSPLKLATRSPRQLSPRRKEVMAGQAIKLSAGTSDSGGDTEAVRKNLQSGITDVEAGQPKPDLVVGCGDANTLSEDQATVGDPPANPGTVAYKDDEEKTEKHIGMDDPPIIQPMLQSIIIEGEAEESDS